MPLAAIKASAKTAIKTLAQFTGAGVGAVPERVHTNPLRNYNGLSPLALMTTTGLDRQELARAVRQSVYTFDLDVMVASNPGDEATAEALHDTILEAIVPALEAVNFICGRIDGTPRGSPLIKTEDGFVYRYSRIPLEYREA
jgi:hypothetical protein